MTNAKVQIGPGFNQVEFDGQTFVSDWMMHIMLPNDETSYEIDVLSRGKGLPETDMDTLDYWRENDPNTLLRMTKSGEFDGEFQDTIPLSKDEAIKIKKLLDEVKEGKQKVLGMMFDNELHNDSIDPIVSFLRPRIVIGAGMLKENGTVRLGDITNKLREEREGRERPPMPRA